MGSNQFWRGKVYDLCVYFMRGAPEGSTESGFMENSEIKPATLVYKAYSMAASWTRRPQTEFFTALKRLCNFIIYVKNSLMASLILSICFMLLFEKNMTVYFLI